MIFEKKASKTHHKDILQQNYGKLVGFFNLVFGEMNEEEKAIIEEKLIKCYNNKGITFDDETLYKEKDINGTKIKTFKQSEDMPILEDLYNILEEDERTRVFKVKLIPFIKGSLKFLNNYTNTENDNKIIVADIYDLGEENIKYRNVHLY